MGACCTGKGNCKLERNSKISNNNKQKNIKNCHRFSNTNVRKLSIDELWNINKGNKYDNTKSKHILQDFKLNSNKKENFMIF